MRTAAWEVGDHVPTGLLTWSRSHRLVGGVTRMGTLGSVTDLQVLVTTAFWGQDGITSLGGGAHESLESLLPK